MTNVDAVEAANYAAAARVAPYHSDDVVARLTLEAIKAAGPVLEIYWLAPDVDGHVAELLRRFDPPLGAVVLDAGCGVGAVADAMARLRPDLTFKLLNISAAQLAMCNPAHEQVLGDFQDIPLADGSVDAVMINYALGHGLLTRVLAEAARVLRPGGVLLIFDMAAADSSRLIRHLGYVAHDAARVVSVASASGLEAVLAGPVPEARHSAHFVKLMAPDAFAHIFEGVAPVLYRFIKAEKKPYLLRYA